MLWYKLFGRYRTDYAQRADGQWFARSEYLNSRGKNSMGRWQPSEPPDAALLASMSADKKTARLPK